MGRNLKERLQGVKSMLLDITDPEDMPLAGVFLVWLLVLGLVLYLISKDFEDNAGKILLFLLGLIVWSVMLGRSIYSKIAEWKTWKTKMEKAVENIEKKVDAILERMD